ncbi:hypothetical protein FIC_01113 [Flavobacteriaceae bacterium 3519-10]|nr:hypothetical protein FIC_01113 [Flavobacteriaceae bacterium 3519-10]
MIKITFKNETSPFFFTFIFSISYPGFRIQPGKPGDG